MIDNESNIGNGGITPPAQKDIEWLGRQRPSTFKTIWSEIGFSFSLLASMFLAEFTISGFGIMIPILGEALDIPPALQSWPASIFSLVVGAFLLPVGRLADIYGAYIVFTSGMIWFTIWSLIAGFSKNYQMLIACRALQGLGPAAFLPAGIMLLGSIYRPGPRKNLIFFLYGAFSPIGFFSGIFIGGVSGQFLTWNWYFWIATILLAISSAIALVTVPSIKSDPSQEIKMDWAGALTIVPGLLLTFFAIMDSSHAAHGWRTPSVYITFTLGGLFLCAAFYVEGWVAAQPLLPFDMFRVKGMTALVISLFFTYGVFGIYLFYASFYIQGVFGLHPLHTTAWFAPMAAGGLVLALSGGYTLHLIPGKLLLIISGLGYVLCVLLFAIMPDNANYWAYVFPAMLGATIGVDITYTVSNVFITTSLPKHRQGLAGALCNSVLFLGISFFLGFADFIVANTSDRGLKGSYKVAFWFGLACAGFALLLLIVFVDIGKAKSDLTIEEKAELEAEISGGMLNTLGGPEGDSVQTGSHGSEKAVN